VGFEITDYAERLLIDLEELDWPDKIKEMQKPGLAAVRAGMIVSR